MTARTVFVPGVPVTQGSKMPGRMVEVAGRRLTAWRTAVGWRATQAGWHRQLFTGPVRLELRFVLPVLTSRPDRYWSHTKSTGDLDKLIRAVGDALTGIAYRDDAQVVQLVASKHHGVLPGVHIRLDPIEQAEPNEVAS